VTDPPSEEPPAAPGAPQAAGHLQVLDPDDVAAVRAVIAAIDAEEARGAVPMVDESERHRLERAADGVATPTGWVALVLRDPDGHVRGYAAAGPPDPGGGPTVGDAAPLARDGGDDTWTRVLPALLDGLARRVADVHGHGHGAHGGPPLQVWVRNVALDDLGPVRDAGVTLERRLGILGRRLDAPVEVPDPAPGTVVRAYRGDADDAEVVAVLAAAYEGTGDGGWTSERFRERRRLPWFRAEDLLLAVDDDGSVGGLHWLKRRDATTGEVYNLAVHPRAQGRRLGPALLGAGLAHLRAVGCEDVLLWVDMANERAVALYASQGFTTRWEDVALRLDGPIEAPTGTR
jgi:mycothiol synthase